jgi:hypothetical protein
MARSSNASRSDSNGSAQRTSVAVRPDRTRRLADGALVQASVRARLLGLPLLRLDATVVLAPAEISAAQSTAHQPARPKNARSPAIPMTDTGHRLAKAVRSINQGAQLLAEVRRESA